jgi:YgiT-type zinc finger domain-containing protein
MNHTELICPNCKNNNLSYCKEDLTIFYKGNSMTLRELEYFVCHHCSESFYTRNSEKIIDKQSTDFERIIDNLLTSDDIIPAGV